MFYTQLRDQILYGMQFIIQERVIQHMYRHLINAFITAIKSLNIYIIRIHSIGVTVNEIKTTMWI